jgi:segregation and condensation protein B
MFGTTKSFLDYFSLRKLDDLPPLADLSDWESLRLQLNLPAVDEDEEELPTGAVTELPVVYREGVEEDIAGDGEQLPAIELVVAAGPDEDAADDRENIDASLTGG